jgi:hypothetical protein
MSQAPISQAPPTTPSDEHLERLHKMSTTAGVTNTGYVAVNQTAVVALVLGVLSAIALFGTLLLVVPIVGIVFAIVAIRQINDSNGTQTGKWMAWAGLALCLAFGGARATQDLMVSAGVKQDEQRIAGTISQLGRELGAGNYAAAYALFDDEFQDRIKPDAFKKTWEAVQAPTPLGRLQVLEWNGITPVFESAGGAKTATAQARMKFTRGNEERVELVMHQLGDRWVVLRFPTFFPEKKPGRQPEDVFDDERLNRPRGG